MSSSWAQSLRGSSPTEFSDFAVTLYRDLEELNSRPQGHCTSYLCYLNCPQQHRGCHSPCRSAVQVSQGLCSGPPTATLKVPPGAVVSFQGSSGSGAPSSSFTGLLAEARPPQAVGLGSCFLTGCWPEVTHTRLLALGARPARQLASSLRAS